MKALLVNEVQEFKRGIGSRESLDIGIEAQKKNWWKNERSDSRDLIISVLNRALKDSNSYMDVYPTSSFGVGYPLEIKYRLETPNPPLKSKYITLIINNKGDIFLPGFDGKYLGNFTELVDKKFEKNLRTNLNRIVIGEEILESINFKRGQDSKKSLGLGEAAIKKQWWEEFKNSDNPMFKFENLMLDLIRDNTIFIRTWVKRTSGTEIPGRVTYLLDKGNITLKSYYLYLYIDSDGDITWHNHTMFVGNLTDLLFSKDKAIFIENLKEIEELNDEG